MRSRIGGMHNPPGNRWLPLLVCVLAACGSSDERGEPTVKDPCAGLTCGAGETCSEGVCLCGAEACGDGSVCDPAASRCRPELEARCASGIVEPGTPAFIERGLELGLEGVEGTRISSADFDGDGYLDLSVRRVGTAADDFAEGGTRATWLLRNDAGKGFVDVTQSAGFVTPRGGGAAGRPGEIVVWADVDNDGDLDAFTGISITANPADGAETAEIMLNDGDGTFSLGPAASDVREEGRAAARAGAAFVDFDRDGMVDLWIGNGAVNGQPKQDDLYRGAGDGSFAEVTRDHGLATRAWNDIADLNEARAHTNSWSVAACDLNGDGAPELLSTSYGRAPNHLWQATDAGYVNRSIASGYAFDDRQDWRDNESARCWCQFHPDDAECEGVPPPELISCTSDQGLRWSHASDREPFRLGGNSGTTVCADVNNDGALDLLTTEIVHWDVGSSSDPSELLLNSGEGDVRFVRPGNEATGLTRVHDRVDWNDGDITAAVFDFDNDGRPDIYIGSTDYPGTRGLLFRQESDGTFALVPPELGIDSLASHGIAVGDFDRDGDLDALVGHSRARCEDQCYDTANVRFFENRVGNAANWLQLRLEGGEGTNRSAIGARVQVRTGDVVQTQEVGGGHGHYGLQHDLTLHFGLADACEGEVTVIWPDAARTTERFTVQAGYRYHVLQGAVPAAE